MNTRMHDLLHNEFYQANRAVYTLRAAMNTGVKLALDKGHTPADIRTTLEHLVERVYDRLKALEEVTGGRAHADE